MSHVTRHPLPITRHPSPIARHTSPFTLHTFTRHTSRAGTCDLLITHSPPHAIGDRGGGGKHKV